MNVFSFPVLRIMLGRNWPSPGMAVIARGYIPPVLLTILISCILLAIPYVRLAVAALLIFWTIVLIGEVAGLFSLMRKARHTGESLSVWCGDEFYIYFCVIGDFRITFSDHAYRSPPVIELRVAKDRLHVRKKWAELSYEFAFVREGGKFILSDESFPEMPAGVHRRILPMERPRPVAFVYDAVDEGPECRRLEQEAFEWQREIERTSLADKSRLKNYEGKIPHPEYSALDGAHDMLLEVIRAFREKV